MKIPKHIMRNIAQITKYAEKMEPLIAEVDEWYGKQMERYEDALHGIPDNYFSDISTNERGLKEFSLCSIEENLRLIEEHL